MDTLPDEALSEVLRRLPPSDRLDSALTCHRWARAMTMSSLLKDVLLTIRGPRMNIARDVLIKSHRRYQNIRLRNVDLSDFDPEFWAHISENVRELELSKCRYTSHVFYEILRTCTRLESLKITNSHYPAQTDSMSDLSLSENTSLESIQDSLRNVRRLHLNMFFTSELLAHLLRAMPNVKSISLSNFRCAPDFVSKMSNLLGMTQLVTSLDLCLISDNREITSLLRLFASNLQELQLTSYEMERSAYEAVRGCTKLRRLKLAANTWFRSVDLNELLSNNPDLESLELIIHWPFPHESLAPLHKLHKLRELSLAYSKPCVPKGMLCGLGEMSTLQRLDLDGPIDDVRICRSIANLPNLHTLRVTYLKSECLDAILENSKNLSALDLGNCFYLTDEDFAKLSHLKQLKSLKVQGGEFTDRALEKGLGPPSLESLTLICGFLSDAALASIATHHDRLRTFILYGGFEMTSRGIVNLLRREPLLRELGLGVAHLNHEYVGELEDLCPRLRVFQILDASCAAVARLEARRPMIEVIEG